MNCSSVGDMSMVILMDYHYIFLHSLNGNKAAAIILNFIVFKTNIKFSNKMQKKLLKIEHYTFYETS